MSTEDTPLPSMRFGRPIFWWRRAAILAAIALLSSSGNAQAIRIVNGVIQTDEPTSGGFTVKKVDPKITDALSDFNRYADKQAWEKAFKAVEPLADVEVNGMLPSKDGFYFPARQAVMNAFLSMSAEGREAYRLFNDARAKQQFEQATNHPDTSEDNISSLRKLVSMYFITSIGQQAADRLGDDLFESGDFGGAEQAWASIVDQQASSDLNIPRIQMKRGLAMVRTRQTSRVKEIIGWLKEHAADAKTVVGGKEVSPAEYLTSLIIETPATTQASVVADVNLPPLVLPQSDTPKWHFKFGDEQIAQQIEQTLRGFGWQNMMPDLLAIVPGSAADDKHVYVNWLGICYGLDARTGKLLWRVDKPTDIGQQIQQFVQCSPEVKRYTVACAGDYALFVRIPPKQMNFQESYRLTCFNAQTGAQKWSSESGTLSGYSFACVPLVVDGTVYATASSNNGPEIFLLAINLANGRNLWSLSLGQATAGTNWRGMQTVPVTNLIYNGGKVYVLTNNGALLAVNVGEKRLMWAFTYDGTPVSQSNFNNSDDIQQQIVTPASMFVRENVLYCKERNADQVYAVDLAGPSLKWKRPCEPEETIVGMDDSRIYTAGREVGGIDCDSKKLLWSRRLPLANGSFRPMMSGDSIFFFLGRGVYQLNTHEGEIKRIFRGYDRDSGGGAVYQTAIGMITVSDQALTAYAMPSSEHAQK